MQYTGSLKREQGKNERGGVGGNRELYRKMFSIVQTTFYYHVHSLPTWHTHKAAPHIHPSPTLHRAMLNSLFFMCFLWQLQPALSTQRNEMCQVMKSTKHKQDNPSPEFHKPSKWKCSLERGGNASRLMKEASSCPPPPMRKFPLLNYSLIYRSNREGGLFCWITDWSTVRSLYRFIEN